MARLASLALALSLSLSLAAVAACGNDTARTGELPDEEARPDAGAAAPDGGSSGAGGGAAPATLCDEAAQHADFAWIEEHVLVPTDYSPRASFPAP